MFSYFGHQILYSNPYLQRTNKAILYSSKARGLKWIIFEVQYVCYLDKVRSQLRNTWYIHNRRNFTKGGCTAKHGNEIFMKKSTVFELQKFNQLILVLHCCISIIKIVLDPYTVNEKLHNELSFYANLRESFLL